MMRMILLNPSLVIDIDILCMITCLINSIDSTLLSRIVMSLSSLNIITTLIDLTTTIITSIIIWVNKNLIIILITMTLMINP